MFRFSTYSVSLLFTLILCIFGGMWTPAGSAQSRQVVMLQSTTPGAQQTGHINVSGRINMGSARWPDGSIQATAASITEAANVKTYGAKGDGTTDDTQAILTAVNELRQRGGGMLYLPKGRYVLSSRIAIDFPIHITGESRRLSQLIWINSNGGIQFNGGSEKYENRKTLVMTNLGLFTASPNGGTAVEATYAVPMGTETNPFVELQNIDVGVISGGTWMVGADLINARGTNIVGCDFRNNRNHSDKQGTAIMFRGDESPVIEVVHDCSAYWWDAMIRVFDTVEGVFVTNSNGVGLDHGIVWDTSGPEPKPHLSVDNCHFHVQLVGISLVDASDAFISNTLIYQWPEPNANGVGITTGGTTENVKISNCTIRIVNPDASYDFNGIALAWNSSYVTVSDNTIWGCASGVWLQPGSNNCKVMDNQIVDASNGNSVIDQGSNNFVRQIP